MEERDDVKDKPNNLCRLCLGSTDVTVPIGQQVDVDQTTSIVEKIQYCTSLVVKVSDNYPQNICTACAEKLDLTFNFKSKAISCDLELSKNVQKDVNFTYIQVSDDPLNMTYKLDLEEQETSTNLGDSCVYNIVDGDELRIEPVNTLSDTNKIIETASNNGNDRTFTVVSINCDNQTSEVITSKLNEKLNDYQNSNTNDNKKNATLDLKRSSDKALLSNDKNKSKKIKIESDIDNEKPSIIVKNGKVVYICGVCNFEAESMGLLLSHRTLAHLDNVGSYNCTECPSNFKTPGILKRHITMHHESTHICKYCDKRFSKKSSVDRHIESHHSNSPLEFQCVKCHAYFDTMDKMEDHLVVHYASPSNLFSCNQCDRLFTTYAAKNKHIDLEHVFEIECDICHVVLPTKEAMEKHNNSVHQPKKKGDKMYACTKCGKYCSGIKDILNHRKTHLSDEV